MIITKQVLQQLIDEEFSRALKVRRAAKLQEVVEPFEPEIIQHLRGVMNELNRMAMNDQKYDPAMPEISDAQMSIKKLMSKLRQVT